MRIWTRFVAACGVILLGAAAPAEAQQAEVMKNFSWSDIRSILGELKATIKKDGEGDGHRYLEAAAENGMNFLVYGYECDNKEPTQRCTGLYFQSSFTIRPERMNEALDAIEFSALADWKGTNERLKVSRYVIFDEGITRANVKVNAKVFLDLSDDVWDKLTDEGYFPPKS